MRIRTFGLTAVAIALLICTGCNLDLESADENGDGFVSRPEFVSALLDLICGEDTEDTATETPPAEEPTEPAATDPATTNTATTDETTVNPPVTDPTLQ